MPADVGQMFYYGNVPWHGEGKKVESPATAEEALMAGGLDWTVAAEPLVVAGTPTTPVSSRVALVRSDRKPGDKTRVVGIVHRSFRPLQNRDGILLFDSLLGEGESHYHTGGYLGRGERIWLLARLPAEITLNGKDVVEPYLLFSNSHDGSLAIDIRLTTVRVVCRNTLSMALRQTTGRQAFRRAHRFTTEQLQVQAGEFVKFALKEVDHTRTVFEALAKARCETTAFTELLDTLLPVPKPPRAGAAAATERAHQTRLQRWEADQKAIRAVHRDGIPDRKIPPADATWWGALNTVTGWVDHLQKTTSDRYAHALFGTGDQLKRRALEECLARSKAAKSDSYI